MVRRIMNVIETFTACLTLQQNSPLSLSALAAPNPCNRTPPFLTLRSRQHNAPTLAHWHLHLRYKSPFPTLQCNRTHLCLPLQQPSCFSVIHACNISHFFSPLLSLQQNSPSLAFHPCNKVYQSLSARFPALKKISPLHQSIIATEVHPFRFYDRVHRCLLPPLQ